VPLYYGRDRSGVPAGWTAKMKSSIASTIWRFSSQRMLHEYTELMYLPARGVHGKRSDGGPPDPKDG